MTSASATSEPADATTAPAPAGMARLATLALGFVMATLDATVINVAGATIKARLAMGLAGITWVVDGYVLSFAALLLVSGALAGRLGPRRVYLGGLAVFVLASLACAIAPGEGVLIAARLIEGVGAALFMPASLGLLVAAFPEAKRRARMLGLWTAIISTASGLGPVVGGVLVAVAGWRSIFMVNIPIGLLAIALTTRLVPALPAKVGRVPLAGHALGVVALAGACFGLIEGPNLGWSSPEVLGAFAAAVIAGASFVWHERRAATPIVPVALFADPRFSAANAVGFLLNLALFGGVFMLGLFLQEARGASPLRAGLELLPVMAVFVIGNLGFARVVSRTGVRVPLIVALAVAGVGTLTLVSIGPAVPYLVLAVVMAATNLGVGVGVPALTAALMQAAGPDNANLGGATLTANRQIGALVLVGVAATGVVLASEHSFYTAAACRSSSWPSPTSPPPPWPGGSSAPTRNRPRPLPPTTALISSGKSATKPAPQQLRRASGWGSGTGDANWLAGTGRLQQCLLVPPSARCRAGPPPHSPIAEKPIISGVPSRE